MSPSEREGSRGSIGVENPEERSAIRQNGGTTDGRRQISRQRIHRDAFSDLGGETRVGRVAAAVEGAEEGAET